MNDRIDERKVMIHLYELSGRAGTICVPKQIKSNPNRLDRDLCTPEYTMAQWLYLTLSDTELEARLESTPENICHPAGTVIQWGPYCRKDERAYKREYLKSDEWKRKRDAVMQRAMQSFMPASPIIRHTVDRYGGVIKSIALERRPICEADKGCTNEATQVHHLSL